MATLSEHHKTLTNGVGKCSVPMWSGLGDEAGFCDEPAFGPQTKEYRAQFPRFQRYPGEPRAVYAPALACPGHGGPKPKCPEGCTGIDLGDGNTSGCECLGEKCDCPNHPVPAPSTQEKQP